jgi:soluble lytic murein transglycosylase-like protein
MLCALATLSWETACRADVFEIRDDGAVVVRGGSGEVHWNDPGDPQTAPDPTPDDADDTPAAAPGIPDTAVTQVALPRVPEAWRAALNAAADQAQLSPDLLAALVWQESRWQPGALSPKGAIGLTQLMPATARSLAVDPHDPAANLLGGARYLRHLIDLFDGDIERALAAYNAGPNRVLRAGGVPPIAETRAYVSTIFDRLAPASVAETGLLK